MKKFKHKKTGWTATESFDGNYWLKDEMESHCIPAELVEGSTDWIEIIEVKKEYEILSYHNPNLSSVIFRLHKDGGYRHHSTVLGVSHGCPIHSVKRLSDGEVFTVGDEVSLVSDLEKITYSITRFSADSVGAFVSAENKLLKKGFGNYMGGVAKVTKVKAPDRKVDKYTYEGKHYVILGYVPFKDPSTRKWLDAVHYLQLESGLDFVREKEEWFNQFKLVE